MPDHTDARTELAAMRKLLTVLEPLDPGARRRIIRWALEIHGTDPASAQPKEHTTDA